MQLDTRIPLAAVGRQPIRFAPESPIESLTAVAPAINALRGVQQQQQQQENQARQDAAFEAFRRGVQEIMGDPNATVSALGRVVINNATTPAQLEAGRKMIEAELAYRQRKERLSGFFDQPMTANALLRMYAEEPEAAKLLESQVLTPSQRTVPVGPNIFERQQDGSGRFITPSRPESPVSGVRLGAQDILVNPQTGAILAQNAPAAGAAPGATPSAAPTAQADARSRYLAARGYELGPDGEVRYIRGGPQDPAVVQRLAEARRPPPPGPEGTPAQQARAEGQRSARDMLSQELNTVMGYYEGLNRMGAMTSPSRAAAANVAAAARATGVGQTAERFLGTEAQTLRDNISNARLRILNHVKNATGATAAQLNSNVELQTWLNALTNPQQSIETVRETLGQMDAVLGSVRNQIERERAASRGGAAPAPAPAPAAATGRVPAPAPGRAPAAGVRREVAPGVFVTEKP
jgi:hypothetical protein